MKFSNQNLNILIDAFIYWIDCISKEEEASELDVFRRFHLLELLRKSNKKSVDLDTDNRAMNYTFTWTLSPIQKFTILRCYGIYGGPDNMQFRKFIGKLDQQSPGLNDHLLKSYL